MVWHEFAMKQSSGKKQGKECSWKRWCLLRMLDLEDLHTAAPQGSHRAPLQSNVGRHCSRQAHDEASLDPNAAYNYLWAKVWVRTFGCAHNISDGEYMAGMLADAGFR